MPRSPTRTQTIDDPMVTIDFVKSQRRATWNTAPWAPVDRDCVATSAFLTNDGILGIARRLEQGLRRRTAVSGWLGRRGLLGLGDGRCQKQGKRKGAAHC
jgi:hypothetical protein